MNERRPIRLHVGMATIVTIFSVLCLTIFSVLTLLSAHSEKQLAEVSAEAIRSYYAAETAVCDRLTALRCGEPDASVTVFDRGGATCYLLTELIDHARLLVCVARAEADGIAVLAITVENAAEWTPQTHINVWIGQ